jgi:signal transduction histidine kinase
MGKLLSSLAKISRASLLRVLPAAFVGLLPFNLLDEALLKSQYSLRGERSPPSSMIPLITSNPEKAFLSHALFEQKGRELGIETFCISFFKNPNYSPSGCLNFDIENRHVLSAYKEIALGSLKLIHKNEIQIEDFQDYSTFFYGHLEAFNPVRDDTFLESPSDFIKKDAGQKLVMILFPEKSALNHFVVTPSGDLDPLEVALNVVTNAQTKNFLLPIRRFSQFLVSLVASILIAWVLYSYPIFLTFLFTFVLGAFLFVISMIMFDRFGIQFPLVAPWASIVTVYLLGMSDRLDKRERRAWSLEQQARNLQTLDELRNNFLSLVSHDLKTPIARIRSVLERFDRGDFGPVTTDQSESLRKILSASGDLQRTISTLLILSRIESRDFRIQREPSDLNELIEKSIIQISTFTAEKRIKIQTEIEPLFLVELDKGLITEVIVNILENAIKYAPADSTITLKSGESPICAELVPPQEGVWIEIVDRGPGIPQTEREKVFQKFVKGSNEISGAVANPVKGTGLGLYLASFFVERHGGVINLFSKTAGEIPEPGAPNDQYFSQDPLETGTVVRVTLPVDGPTERI